MDQPTMSFDAFLKAYDGLPASHLRKGQALMRLLADVWWEEYKRTISLDYYDRTDIDCFYVDALIPNTLTHLRSVWKNFDTTF